MITVVFCPPYFMKMINTKDCQFLASVSMVISSRWWQTVGSIFFLVASNLLHGETPVRVHPEVLDHIFPRSLKCFFHDDHLSCSLQKIVQQISGFKYRLLAKKILSAAIPFHWTRFDLVFRDKLELRESYRKRERKWIKEMQSGSLILHKEFDNSLWNKPCDEEISVGQKAQRVTI